MTRKNQFADYYDVRVSDRHAWVEAYISDKGWQIFDATPYSSTVQRTQASGFMMTLRDWMDYLWYSKIVEFSSNDQNIMLTYLVSAIKKGVSFSMRNITAIILIAVAAIFFYFLGKIRFTLKPNSHARQEKQAIQLDAAEKFYTDMLESLAKRKIYRRINQTPYEFATSAGKIPPNIQDDIKLITDNFCLVKYGEIPLTVKQIQLTTEAVENIKMHCDAITL